MEPTQFVTCNMEALGEMPEIGLQLTLHTR